MFKQKKLLNYLFAIVFSILFITIGEDVKAQVGTSGIAVPVQLAEEYNVNGNVICLGEGQFIGCETEYSQTLYGVVTTEPSVAFEIEGEEVNGTALVVTSGVAKVRVSSSNGNIEEGDLLTSSSVVGVSQKAEQSGYVIGSALEAYESEDSEAVGTILVAINIHPASGVTGQRSNLFSALRQGLRAPVFDPLDSLRYFLAALIVLISFALGFIYFGRVGKAGVEAIGRNPLASKMIQMSIIIHVVVTIVIILVGLFLAYLILIL